MPRETTTEERRLLADEASERVMGVAGVETVGEMTGGSNMLMMSGTGGGGGGQGVLSSTTIYALLDQQADIEQVTGDIEAALEGVDATFEVSAAAMMSASALGGDGITVNIYGDTIENMMAVSEAVTERTEGIEGVAEISNGLEDATPALHFTVDRAKAATYGLTTAQVFQQVSGALAEQRSSTEITWDTESFEVAVVNEKADEDALSPAYIKDLEFTVTKRDGSAETVKLADISTLSESQTLPTVQRSEQRRYLPVSLTVDEEHNITLVTQEVERALAGIELPAGVTYEVTGENTTIMEAFQELGLMLLLGLLLVYLIMVAQFQSLKNPFIIMFTIPLAFTGGFLALLITGQVLSVISLIGFAMLIGVIVSNAIVLVDYINRLRREGTERVAAIREAAATRMRPILMTALTTIFALLVMALGVGNGSEMMQPLAIVCIGGLTYGTLMTLFVIPIIYDLFNRKDIRVIDEDDLAAINE
jgi:multidrug efflux pump subunit AcrB